MCSSPTGKYETVRLICLYGRKLSLGTRFDSEIRYTKDSEIINLLVAEKLPRLEGLPMLTTIITSIVSFIGTNVDDTFVLAVWFSQVNAVLRKRDIVWGQFIGFELLVLVSVFAAYGLSFLPTDKVGWLGVIPIILGFKRWLNYRHQPDPADEEAAITAEIKQKKKISPRATAISKVINPQMVSVSLVTISNGAGNLTVYIPLFTRYSVPELVITVLVFTLMTGVWCCLGLIIANLPVIKDQLERYRQVLIPVIFIAIGIYVLVESGVLMF